MENIRTAGEQRYYDFISDRAKQVRTGMIVWASLLSLALISLFNNIIIALILVLAAAALAVPNIKAQKKLKGKLDGIPDQKEFFCQLASPEVFRTRDGHVLMTKDYVLTSRDDIFIYYIPDMEKAEISPKRNAGNTLFLTDRKGVKHEIMSCTKKEKEELEALYRALKKRCS